jgi:hypothetical protein
LSATIIGPALAQEKPEQEASSYKGLSGAELKSTYCIYNDKLFTKGSEICVRKGAALKCEGGNWAVVANVCQTAPDAHPAF